MNEWEIVLQDLRQNKEASPYFQSVMDQMRANGIEPKGINDVMNWTIVNSQGSSGVAAPPPGQVQQAGVGEGGSLLNPGPALKWLKGLFSNPNKYPYRSANWGTAGEQFGRSVDRMKLRDE